MALHMSFCGLAAKTLAAGPSIMRVARHSCQAGQRRGVSLSSYLVTPEEFSEALKTNIHTKISTAPRIIPLCAAWFLPNDPQQRTGQQVFEQQRIPRSRFFDIDKVKDDDSAYPHMLPTAEDFAKEMQVLGIRRDDSVVIYDTKELGIFSAPRVGWTFKVFGHPSVHILNNFRLWVDEGYLTESGPIEETRVEPSRYPTPSVNPDLVVKFAEVKEIAKDFFKEGGDGTQLLDARSHERWSGAAPEPRPGLPSGHIPGSLNIPHSAVLDPKTGAYLPRDRLCEIFKKKGVDADKPVITTCGTGVTAAVIDAALKEANYGKADDLRLYDGSWTEWAQRVSEKDKFIRTA